MGSTKISLPMRVNARGGTTTGTLLLQEEIGRAMMPSIDFNPYNGRDGLHRQSFAWESLSPENMQQARAFVRAQMAGFERAGRARLRSVEVSGRGSDGQMVVAIEWFDLEAGTGVLRTTTVP